MRCGIVGSAMGRGILFADGVAGVRVGGFVWFIWGVELFV